MIEQSAFRRLMGLWATGVSVVTSEGDDDRPAGATLNAISSLSLDPMLLLVCFDLSARTLGAVRQSGRFCVNTLSIEQEEISRRFVGKHSMAEKFEGLDYSLEQGPPIIAGCLMAIVCDVQQEAVVGDHVIVIGSPTYAESRDDLEPLLFFRGAYAAIDGARTSR